MSGVISIGMAALFHAAVLFLLTAGLQLTFGVMRVVNLACGTLFALGAYAGATAVNWALAQGAPVEFFPLILLGCGAMVGLIGIPIERLLRAAYARPEAFQLLLTFALVLILQDLLRLIWGADPKQTQNVMTVFGSWRVAGATINVYYVAVIAFAIALAFGLGWFLERTNSGKILRATAENREASSAMGINVPRTYLLVFTAGTMLSTAGGALIVPTAAASLQMGVELVVEAFAVVVIGGLGSMKGAAVGAILVCAIRALALNFFPELDILAVYVVVLGVLILRPSGLCGRRFG